MTSIYDFSLENQNGEEIPLSHYQGKVPVSYTHLDVYKRQA